MDAAVYERRRQTIRAGVIWTLFGFLAILPGVYLSHRNMTAKLTARPAYPIPEEFSFKPATEPTLTKPPPPGKRGPRP